MDIGVPSRFACLKIEDDDFKPVSTKPKKKPESKQQQIKKQEKSGKQDSNKKNYNKPTNAASSATNKKPKKKQQQPTAKQWEEWKEKDNELVNGNFEADLQNAILLSKLDFEKNKDMYQQHQKDAKKDNQTGKKKKNKVMSLNQFLGNNSESVTHKIENNIEHKSDKDFFERIKQEAKAALTKEEVSQERKKREENIDEVIANSRYQNDTSSASKYKEKLEREIAKNAALQLELEKARKEIVEVKARNKTLCNILGDGEMKDKADVLLELQRLNGLKNELTEEVTRLHGLLEQERSKVAALTADSQHKYKDKKQKKAGSNNK